MKFKLLKINYSEIKIRSNQDFLMEITFNNKSH